MAKILIVDDDVKFTELLQSILQELGHHAELSADGVQAVEKLRTESFDVLVLDLIMPKKDGLEVLIDIRKQQKDLKVIAMSGGGYGSASDYLSWAKTLGVHRTLPKPFSRDEFLLAVSECLGME